MINKNTHIYFVGIGGIGMSAIATVLKKLGYTVSGCDKDLSQQSVQNLLQLGCKVYPDNNTPVCSYDMIDIVVYSTAIKSNHPERVAAIKRGIPVIHRSLMLAFLMQKKESIAIAGSHGKTTTSALTSHILLETEQDPTIIIGGHMQSIGTNGRMGQSPILVTEADESDRSLTELYPSIAVITNIDLEHLDTYSDLEDIKQTFILFLCRLPFYGKALLCGDDQHTISIIKRLPKDLQERIITYGFSPSADFYIADYQLNPSTSTATVCKKNEPKPLGTFTVTMPGKHNALNALAALVITQQLHIPFSDAAHALSTFTGVDRRFTYKGTYRNAEIFDDYGHHPVEIHHTLLAAHKRTKNKLIVLFQPQRYTRTAKLWDDFITTLANAPIDHLVITDIYSAGESPIANITSRLLVQKLQERAPHKKIIYLSSEKEFHAIHTYLEKSITNDDLLLFLGAGKINTLAKRLIQKQKL